MRTTQAIVLMAAFVGGGCATLSFPIHPATVDVQEVYTTQPCHCEPFQGVTHVESHTGTWLAEIPKEYQVNGDCRWRHP